MSLFDGNDLFSSGPHRFQIGGLSLRHVLHGTPQSQGVHITATGRHGRSIHQTGTLVADSPTQMTAQRTAIESKLDGRAVTLVDGQDRAWPNTVMLSFEPEQLTRAGNRYKLDYQVHYLQAVV